MGRNLGSSSCEVLRSGPWHAKNLETSAATSSNPLDREPVAGDIEFDFSAGKVVARCSSARWERRIVGFKHKCVALLHDSRFADDDGYRRYFFRVLRQSEVRPDHFAI